MISGLRLRKYQDAQWYACISSQPNNDIKQQSHLASFIPYTTIDISKPFFHTISGMKPILCVANAALVILFLQWLPSLRAQQQQQQQQQDSIAIECDFNNDACPSQFNGICEASTKSRCYQGDCYDCDPCHALHYTGCETCAQYGCRWCPGDAFCSSQPLEAPVWQRIQFLFDAEISSSCAAVEDWVTTCGVPTNTTTTDHANKRVFSDPLYDAMAWAYDLINVAPVWNRGILGQGVRIRVNDNGVDNLHPEFANTNTTPTTTKFDIAASCDNNYRPRNMTRDVHGTAVASLVAGNANNGHCAVGIAPRATLSSCVIHDVQATAPTDLADTIDAKLEHMDISMNSWGVQTCARRSRLPRNLQSQSAQPQQECPFRSDHRLSPCHVCSFSTTSIDHDNGNPDLGLACEAQIVHYCALRYEHDPAACSDYLDLFVQCGYNALTAGQQAALTRGVQQGRDGKGVIYVFSSGNSYAQGGDANFDGWVNTRYTISVGGVGKAGRHASYSTIGAALFVVGPGRSSYELSLT